MKKWVVLLILLFPLYVYAAKNNNEKNVIKDITMVCDKVDKINLNENIICRVSLNAAFVYDKISFKILNTEGIQIVDVRSNYEKRWSISKDNDKYVVSSSEKQSDLQEFGIILIKMVKSGKQDLVLDEISLENSDSENKKELDGISASLKVLSSDNLLKSICINGESLNGFNNEITEYKINIKDDENIKIEAEANNEFAKINGIGEFKLSKETNRFIYPIEVLSENNIAKIYTLELVRDKISDTNLVLDDLNISDDKGNTILINFKPNVYNYSFDTNINSKYIIVKPTTKNYSLVKEYGEQKIELKSGNNIALIKITNDNKEVVTYVINITKPIENKSSNNYIKSIDIDGYNLKFSKRVKNYNLEIRPSDKKLNMNIELDNPNARYVVSGNENLKDGSSIKIEVTAENEEKMVYKINIKVIKPNYLGIVIKILLGILGGYLLYKLINKIYKKVISNKKKKVYNSKKKNTNKNLNIKQNRNPKNSYTKKNSTKKKSSSKNKNSIKKKSTTTKKVNKKKNS